VDVRIGYQNFAFRESHELVLAGAGASVEAGALANLRTAQLDQRVTIRSAGTGNRSFYLEDLPDTPAGRTVRAVALLDIEVETVGNITGVTFEVECSGSSGSVSTTAVPVPLMPDGFPRHLIFNLPADCTDCQQVRVWITGAAAIGDEVELVLTASALWISPSVAIEEGLNTGLQEGSSFGIEDAGTVQRTPGGQVYGETSSALRTHSGSTIHLPRALAFGDGSGGMDIQQLMVVARTTQPILWMPYTSSEHLLHRTTIYGHFTQLGRLTPRGPYDRWEGWAVREAR
jgi:hypothetical protein